MFDSEQLFLENFTTSSDIVNIAFMSAGEQFARILTKECLNSWKSDSDKILKQ